MDFKPYVCGRGWLAYLSLTRGLMMLDRSQVMRLGLTSRRKRNSRGLSLISTLRAGVSLQPPIAGHGTHKRNALGDRLSYNWNAIMVRLWFHPTVSVFVVRLLKTTSTIAWKHIVMGSFNLQSGSIARFNNIDPTGVAIA